MAGRMDCSGGLIERLVEWTVVRADGEAGGMDCSGGLMERLVEWTVVEWLK